MKRILLLLGLVLMSAACAKDLLPSNDKSLEGVTVDKLSPGGTYAKLFVLNEGSMGSNNASLDFLRLKEGNYVNGAFKKMNPELFSGLGDVGNDIAVNGKEVWIAVNNSGLVEVISALDETEIAAIPIPTPRNIAFDSNYAYVTSWAGAYLTSEYDASGQFVQSNGSSPRGQVYRINLKTKKAEGSVEVGYQPEGIAYYNGKLYVANSGGISSMLPPAYSYDNTVSIIDAGSFSVVQTVEVEVNLKNVYSDGAGVIYVTTLGNYFDVHSGLYYFYADKPTEIHKAGKNLQQPGDLQVSCSCGYKDMVFCVATVDEFDWSVAHTYYVWSFKIADYEKNQGQVTMYPLEPAGTPYGIGIVENSGNPAWHYIFIGDAGDYFNPGSVTCYQLDFGNLQKLWRVSAGVCPGHFAVW